MREAAKLGVVGPTRSLVLLLVGCALVLGGKVQHQHTAAAERREREAEGGDNPYEAMRLLLNMWLSPSADVHSVYETNPNSPNFPKDKPGLVLSVYFAGPGSDKFTRPEIERRIVELMMGHPELKNQFTELGPGSTFDRAFKRLKEQSGGKPPPAPIDAAPGPIPPLEADDAKFFDLLQKLWDCYDYGTELTWDSYTKRTAQDLKREIRKSLEKIRSSRVVDSRESLVEMMIDFYRDQPAAVGPKLSRTLKVAMRDLNMDLFGPDPEAEEFVKPNVTLTYTRPRQQLLLAMKMARIYETNKNTEPRAVEIFLAYEFLTGVRLSQYKACIDAITDQVRADPKVAEPFLLPRDVDRSIEDFDNADAIMQKFRPRNFKAAYIYPCPRIVGKSAGNTGMAGVRDGAGYLKNGDFYIPGMGVVSKAVPGFDVPDIPAAQRKEIESVDQAVFGGDRVGQRWMQLTEDLEKQGDAVWWMQIFRNYSEKRKTWCAPWTGDWRWLFLKAEMAVERPMGDPVFSGQLMHKLASCWKQYDLLCRGWNMQEHRHLFVDADCDMSWFKDFVPGNRPTLPGDTRVVAAPPAAATAAAAARTSAAPPAAARTAAAPPAADTEGDVPEDWPSPAAARTAAAPKAHKGTGAGRIAHVGPHAAALGSGVGHDKAATAAAAHHHPHHKAPSVTAAAAHHLAPRPHH